MLELALDKRSRKTMLFKKMKIPPPASDELSTPIRRALISVWDKTGIEKFANSLYSEFGVEILSTGGTSDQLRKSNIPVTDVSKYTGFPEIMDGRVKTLHPKIHGGLLCVRDNGDHLVQANKNGIDMIDLVVVNLYPFEQTIEKPDVTLEEAIENIDIGGPAMLRSAAKNYRSVTVAPSSKDYSAIITSMRMNNGATTLDIREQLAVKVFMSTEKYDGAIKIFLNSMIKRPQEI